jgi:4-amino-4-deoxy-L-arabinose transferase-like glycosyltransferase
MTITERTGSTRLGRWLPAILPILLILLVAFALRAWNLTDIPPGLTHDEANHGREAIGILNGVFLFFFPLNYGSEPLYSYTVALFMKLLGPGLLALRLVNVVFGLATVAATYFWAGPRLGRPVGLLAGALMAISFWPLAASREALRAGMLPFFMVLAVWFFWRILELTTDNGRWTLTKPDATKDSSIVIRHSSFVIPVVGFGLSVALTLHIYLAARVSWLLFPVFLIYLALFHHTVFHRSWRPVIIGLLLAGLLVVPMFLYLRAHPEMQTRLDMLDKPIQAIATGQLGPILANARDALLAFVWPGYGDQFLAYNIPGRPVFDPISAVFFVAGLATCLWRWRRPVFAFLLMWFVIGIIPSLITGPTANTTRNMAALPAAYLIAAVGFYFPASRLVERGARFVPHHSSLVARHSSLVILLALPWIMWAGWTSAQDYFIHWGRSPEVRGAYQQNLVATLNHLTANYPEVEPVVFSSIYPGPAHDASIALVLASDSPAISETARWVDARRGMALPATGETLVAIPSSTPPHPIIAGWFNPIERVELRPEDLDPSITLYEVDRETVLADLEEAQATDPPADFGGAIRLLGANWLAETNQPGGTAELITYWRVLDPARAGPVVPPSFTTDAVFFTHVQDESGQIIAQYDGLDAPSWAWRAGDLIVQIHPIAVPEGTDQGNFKTVVGIYDRTSGTRLPVGQSDAANVPPLIIRP